MEKNVVIWVRKRKSSRCGRGGMWKEWKEKETEKSNQARKKKWAKIEKKNRDVYKKEELEMWKKRNVKRMIRKGDRKRQSESRIKLSGMGGEVRRAGRLAGRQAGRQAGKRAGGRAAQQVGSASIRGRRGSERGFFLSASSWQRLWWKAAPRA